jgi:hypothetical protein
MKGNTHINEIIIEHTKAWVSSVIVKHNICPFAGRAVERETIRYSVQESTDVAECLGFVLNECRILDMDKEVETSLLIFAEIFCQFDDYLDFVDMANALMLEQGYAGVYQLASFHPDYCFADADYNDAANYTNRSPYPMLHIIREASLQQALEDYPDPESIPERNIALTRQLGVEKMQAMLQACYDINNNRNEN